MNKLMILTVIVPMLCSIENAVLADTQSVLTLKVLRETVKNTAANYEKTVAEKDIAEKIAVNKRSAFENAITQVETMKIDADQAYRASYEAIRKATAAIANAASAKNDKATQAASNAYNVAVSDEATSRSRYAKIQSSYAKALAAMEHIKNNAEKAAVSRNVADDKLNVAIKAAAAAKDKAAAARLTADKAAADAKIFISASNKAAADAIQKKAYADKLAGNAANLKVDNSKEFAKKTDTANALIAKQPDNESYVEGIRLALTEDKMLYDKANKAADIATEKAYDNANAAMTIADRAIDNARPYIDASDKAAADAKSYSVSANMADADVAAKKAAFVSADELVDKIKVHLASAEKTVNEMYPSLAAEEETLRTALVKSADFYKVFLERSQAIIAMDTSAAQANAMAKSLTVAADEALAKSEAALSESKKASAEASKAADSVNDKTMAVEKAVIAKAIAEVAEREATDKAVGEIIGTKKHVASQANFVTKLDSIIQQYRILSNITLDSDNLPIKQAYEQILEYRSSLDNVKSLHSALIGEIDAALIKQLDDNITQSIREKFDTAQDKFDFLKGRLTNNILLYTNKEHVLSTIAKHMVEIRADRADILPLLAYLPKDAFEYRHIPLPGNPKKHGVTWINKPSKGKQLQLNSLKHLHEEFKKQSGTKAQLRFQ